MKETVASLTGSLVAGFDWPLTRQFCWRLNRLPGRTPLVLPTSWLGSTQC
jgi:hypothetical protein